MNITSIIFDIGCVLVNYDWKTYLHQYGYDSQKETAIGRAMFDGPYWKEVDRGVWTSEQLVEAFASLAPEYHNEIETVFAHAEQCVSRLPYARPWIKELKAQGFHVYYLSNYSGVILEKTRSSLNFLDLMDGGLFSYEVSLVKPDPAIYRTLFDRYPQIIPEQTVFFDDSKINIEAAQKLGLHGILFQNQQQAQDELQKLIRK